MAAFTFMVTDPQNGVITKTFKAEDADLNRLYNAMQTKFVSNRVKDPHTSKLIPLEPQQIISLLFERFMVSIIDQVRDVEMRELLSQVTTINITE